MRKTITKGIILATALSFSSSYSKQTSTDKEQEKVKSDVSIKTPIDKEQAKDVKNGLKESLINKIREKDVKSDVSKKTPVDKEQPKDVKSDVSKKTPVDKKQPKDVKKDVSKKTPVDKEQPKDVKSDVSTETPVDKEQPKDVKSDVSTETPVDKEQPKDVKSDTLKKTPTGQEQWKDVKKGLVWSRCTIGTEWSGSSCSGEAKVFDWYQASEYVNFYNENVALGGNKNWRLPKIHELAALRKCTKGWRRNDQGTYGQMVTTTIPNARGRMKTIPLRCDITSVKPTINSRVFPNTKGDLGYWAAEQTRDDESLSWAVDFEGGYPHRATKISKAHLFLVRNDE